MFIYFVIALFYFTRPAASRGMLVKLQAMIPWHIAKASIAVILHLMALLHRILFAQFALLFLTMIAMPVWAQRPLSTVETATIVEEEFTDGPAIFVVRDDDTTLYFLGTTHVLPPEIQWQTNDIQALFAKSEELVLEVSDNDSKAAEADMEKLFLERKRGSGSLLLAELIWPENRAEFRKWARGMNVTARELDAIPLWQFSFIYEYGLAFDAGATSEDGVESVLSKIYTDAGKPIGSIESPSSGLSGLAALSEEDQIAPFNAILYERRFGRGDTAEYGADLFAEEKAWAQGVVTEFDFGDEHSLLKDGTYRALIYERNVQWADWIIKRMERPGHLLIAVGSAHLSGPHSVLRLLEKRGFKVERLTKSMLYAPR